MKRTLRRAGFTLVELLLALGLLTILVLALIRLLDTSLNIWGRTEASRDLLEMGSSVLDLVADDLVAIDGGPRGDLLCEWTRFDTDQNGLTDMLWPRLTFVRQATRADRARIDPDGTRDARSVGLLEVGYAVLPPGGSDPAKRSMGVLWRGERLLGDGGTLSFFDPGFYGNTSKPVAGAFEEVTGGVLWFELQFASQTTIVRDGWKAGEALQDSSLAWDAWGRQRIRSGDIERNRLAAGMPAADELPVLPRRVRIEVELERPAELRKRAHLIADIDAEATTLRVDDETRLPESGAYVLLDEEWVQIVSKSRGRVGVLRAVRDSRPTTHAAGVLLHHGWKLVREVAVPLYREDWNL